MPSVVAIDSESQLNAPIAVTHHALQRLASTAGRPMAEVACIGSRRLWLAQNPSMASQAAPLCNKQLSWSD
jgi:hypothetical protein